MGLSFKDRLSMLSSKQYLLIAIGLTYMVLGMVVLAGVQKWGSATVEMSKRANSGIMMISTFTLGYSIGKFLVGRDCKVWDVHVPDDAPKEVKKTAKNKTHAKMGIDIGGIVGGIVLYILSIAIQAELDKSDVNADKTKKAAIGVIVMGLFVMLYAALFSLDI